MSAKSTTGLEPAASAKNSRRCFQGLVSTFNETMREGEFKRVGIEINTKMLRVRLGWIGGYIPTNFYCGTVKNHWGTQSQLRVWRLAISYCANEKSSESAAK